MDLGEICENYMLRNGNLGTDQGWKWGSLARHVPNMHINGSTPPPRELGAFVHNRITRFLYNTTSHLSISSCKSLIYVEIVQAPPNKKGYEVTLFESMWSYCEQVHLVTVMLWRIIIVIVMFI